MNIYRFIYCHLWITLNSCLATQMGCLSMYDLLVETTVNRKSLSSLSRKQTLLKWFSYLRSCSALLLLTVLDIKMCCM